MSPEAKKEQARNMTDTLKRYYDLGGRVVIGTDLIHSSDFMADAKIPVIELKQLRAAGIPFQDVIKTGTLWPAQVLGTAAEEGSIEAGKLANLIAIPGELTDSFEALDHPAFVMHYGTVVRSEL